jgi:hypothetical protein
MTDDFESIMFERSDNQLIEILTTNRNDYQSKAIEAAEKEFSKRGLNIDSFKKKEESQILENSNIQHTPSSDFGKKYKLLTLFFPIIVSIIFQIKYQEEDPALILLYVPFSITAQFLMYNWLLKKHSIIASDFKKWSYYSWLLVMGLMIAGFIFGFLMATLTELF